MRQASTGMGKLGTNKIIHLNIFLTVLRKNLKVEETDFLKISKGKPFSFGNWLLYLTFFLAQIIVSTYGRYQERGTKVSIYSHLTQSGGSAMIWAAAVVLGIFSKLLDHPILGHYIYTIWKAFSL